MGSKTMLKSIGSILLRTGIVFVLIGATFSILGLKPATEPAQAYYAYQSSCSTDGTTSSTCGYEIAGSRVYHSSTNTTTFTYTVTRGQDAQGLSHFTLGFCADHEDLIVPSLTTSPYTVGRDGSTGVWGIKWETPSAGSTATFTVTFSGNIPEGQVQVIAKAGNCKTTGWILGPACGAPPTATPEPPTATPEPPTATPEPPTATPEPPTATPEPPTATPEPPTATPEPPTATPEPPTATPEPPTATPEAATATPEAPTATPNDPSTATPVPPTNTPAPKTSTPTPPTNTPVPPTNTPPSYVPPTSTPFQEVQPTPTYISEVLAPTTLPKTGGLPLGSTLTLVGLLLSSLGLIARRVNH